MIAILGFNSLYRIYHCFPYVARINDDHLISVAIVMMTTMIKINMMYTLGDVGVLDYNTISHYQSDCLLLLTHAISVFVWLTYASFV